MSIRGDFIRYVDYVFQVLEQACRTVCEIALTDLNDFDLIDYVCDFCMGIFEAYSGIIHGLDESKNIEKLVPQLNIIMEFIVYIAKNKNVLRNPQLEKAAIGTLGDIFQSLGNQAKEYANNNLIQEFVRSCKSSNDGEISKIAQWVHEIMPHF